MNYANAYQKKKKNSITAIWEKIDFKARNVTRYKGHFVMIKGSIYQDDIRIQKVYAPKEKFKIYNAKKQMKN